MMYKISWLIKQKHSQQMSIDQSQCSPFLTDLSPPHFWACPKPGHGFLTSYIRCRDLYYVQ